MISAIAISPASKVENKDGALETVTGIEKPITLSVLVLKYKELLY